MRSSPRLPIIATLLMLAQATLHAETVAISSVVFNGYAREQQPDGTFKPEFYTFGEGGRWSRPINDPWMEKLTFIDVAKVVASPLARMNFRPALKSADATLLILVFWGSTEGSRENDPSQAVDRTSAAVANYRRAITSDPKFDPTKSEGKGVDSNSPEGAEYETALWMQSLANLERDEIDNRNARILGYSEAADRARYIQGMSMGRDVLEELGGNRYYVVLQAYDFKTALQHKKLKPLWTTRMSVGEGGAFVPALQTMVASGARYFGRDSDGLRRQREAKVDLAPLQVLEVVSPAK